MTPSREVKRQLVLYRGVDSILVDIQGSFEAQILSVEKAVIEHGFLKPGDVVVITMGSPLSSQGTTNLLKVHQFAAKQ